MILKLFKLSLLLATIFIVCTVNAEAVNLESEINSLIQQSQPDADLGILVKDINTGKIIYQKNAQQLFIPASNLKLLTTAAALLSLGADFRYRTLLATDAQNINQQQLEGNLYLIMSGDPSLTTPKIADLFKQLINRYGITQINGDIIVVPAYTLTATYPAGTEQEDEQYYYGAALTPFVIDENAWPLVVNPSNQTETLANVKYLANLETTVNNQILTTESDKDCSRDFQVNSNNEANLTGCIGLHDLADFEYLAINNPFLYLKHQLNQILSDDQLQLKGKIKLASAPQNLTPLSYVESERLSSMINHTLKTSDNLYANALLMTIAQQETHSRDLSWEKAAAALTQTLQKKLQLNLKNSRIYDGAGLSSDDRISPDTLVNLISQMHQQFSNQYEFFDALPVSGHYGSLNRIPEMDLNGKIRAKTGSMTGVYNVSGLLKTKNHQLLVFSIMLNQGKKDKNDNVALFSKIATILYDPEANLKNESDLSFNAHQKSKKIDALEKQLRQQMTTKDILITRLWGEIDINMPAADFIAKANQFASIIKQNEYADLISAILIPLNSINLNSNETQNTEQLFSPYKVITSIQNRSPTITIKLFYLN